MLFLVDRLELEDQAKKAFVALLSADFQTVIYKESRDDWQRAEIVTSPCNRCSSTTNTSDSSRRPTSIWSSPTEAHRSIGGNARAVFDYFIGWLGLTATPRDYLKRFDRSNPTTRDPREAERRLLLDTYRTFGCENSQPTFRYSLLDGVKDGYLINPRWWTREPEITTELLSKKASSSPPTTPAKISSGPTSSANSKNASSRTPPTSCSARPSSKTLRDPVSGEVGKSIVFAVSQNHAAKLAQILNQMADHLFPGKYQSDFAVQVTSQVPDAQQFTINFTNNNLLGSVTNPPYRPARQGCVSPSA